jgi:hypothetical protein
MIEAVNSVVANAPLIRGNAESAASSRAAAPISAPKAPYISPYVHLDVNYDMAVLQIRDSDTGDVVRTIPSEGSLQSRVDARTAASEARVSPVQVQDIEFSAPQQPQAAPQQAAITALSTGSRTGVSQPGASSGVGISITA